MSTFFHGSIRQAGISLLALLLITGCSNPADQNAGDSAKPATPQASAANKDSMNSAQPAEAEKSVEFDIDAPAGTYRLDPNHSSLSFTVRHLGLSNYVARFARHDVTIELNPEDISQSSVDVSVDPLSVSTLYSGDYKGTHPDSKFSSWNDDLAKSEKFFNAGEYPEITFKSTNIKAVGKHELEIEGDLTLLGKTQPITLTAVLVGSAQKHPVYQQVDGAMGFSAIGEFKRSDFGMNYLLKPPLIGDSVVMNFEGEFQQKKAE